VSWNEQRLRLFGGCLGLDNVEDGLPCREEDSALCVSAGVAGGLSERASCSDLCVSDVSDQGGFWGRGWGGLDMSVAQMIIVPLSLPSSLHVHCSSNHLVVDVARCSGGRDAGQSRCVEMGEVQRVGPGNDSSGIPLSRHGGRAEVVLTVPAEVEPPHSNGGGGGRRGIRWVVGRWVVSK